MAVTDTGHDPCGLEPAPPTYLCDGAISVVEHSIDIGPPTAEKWGALVDSQEQATSQWSMAGIQPLSDAKALRHPLSGATRIRPP